MTRYEYEMQREQLLALSRSWDFKARRQSTSQAAAACKAEAARYRTLANSLDLTTEAGQ